MLVSHSVTTPHSCTLLLYSAMQAKWSTTSVVRRKRVDDRAVALRCCQDRYYSNRRELLSSASTLRNQRIDNLEREHPACNHDNHLKIIFMYPRIRTIDTVSKRKIAPGREIFPIKSTYCTPKHNLIFGLNVRPALSTCHLSDTDASEKASTHNAYLNSVREVSTDGT